MLGSIILCNKKTKINRSIYILLNIVSVTSSHEKLRIEKENF